ncbi:YceI family protein [Seonamhaeicola maritimus]|uniref:YceI family protein n=1 Tax=Seonamhaeicola maritimus TaxID=2591822 RepID=A0A5C7GM13_9FLAO|nr:YceI family protein [Seonamhaeicola maritimus]TXG39328.1 YceI family protein [Seonamhaeicola maritimus]
MKTLLFIITLIFGISSFAQSKFITKTGTVGFEASVPSFEEVRASNNSVTAIINTDTGEFAALVLVKGFRFKNALMEEHFNENYAESDTYPKATFKGRVKDFDLAKLKSKTQEFVIVGALAFHGKTKKLTDVPLSISQNEGVITIEGSFKTLASDFDIKIPKIVKNKIAEDVLVTFDFKLNKK